MAKPDGALEIVVGDVARSVIWASPRTIIDLVSHLYALRKAGNATDCPSQFLWYPNTDRSRLITLTARVDDGESIAGVKSIASFPSNRALGIPRASAAILLHDPATGFPMACVEGGIISAARTAASAVLAARHLTSKRQIDRLAVIGNGLIAKYVLDFLLADGWRFGHVGLFDLDSQQAARFARHFQANQNVGEISVHATARACSARAELVLFATTAMRPHVLDLDFFTPGQIVLHLSLRDIAPQIILRSGNVVDNVEHCLQAQTSVHLAEQLANHRDFILGDIVDLALGRIEISRDKPLIFSPFGMGVLDIGVASFVHKLAQERSLVTRVPQFVGDLEAV